MLLENKEGKTEDGKMKKTFEMQEYGRIPDEALSILYSNMNPQKLSKEDIRLNYGYMFSSVQKHARIWSSICFDRTYRLFGHVAGMRPDCSAVMASDFTYHFIKNVREDHKPTVGFIHFTSKKIAELLAGKSPLFETAWIMLKNLDEQRRWLCFCDPLPRDWIATMEEKDDATIQALIQFEKNWI